MNQENSFAQSVVVGSGPPALQRLLDGPPASRMRRRGVKQRRGAPCTEAANDANRSSHPNACGRSQSLNVESLVPYDDSGTEETDAGQHPLNDATGRIQVATCIRRSQIEAGHHRQRRTEPDQAEGAHAGGFAVKLAVQSNGGADEGRDSPSEG